MVILKDELRSKIEENVKLKKEAATLEEVANRLKEKAKDRSKLMESKIGDCNGEIYKVIELYIFYYNQSFFLVILLFLFLQKKPLIIVIYEHRVPLCGKINLNFTNCLVPSLPENFYILYVRKCSHHTTAWIYVVGFMRHFVFYTRALPK